MLAFTGTPHAKVNNIYFLLYHLLVLASNNSANFF
jgi:hypothetical protein